MPYVITKTERCPGIATCPDLTSDHQSRRAVATLEGIDRCRIHDARPTYETRCGPCGAIFEHEPGAKNIASQFVFEHTEETMQPWLAQVTALPESGGTIGPLPDGTVIEVERVSWLSLLKAAFPDHDHGDVYGEDEIIDAYNARS
jgi:hypothetical protein